MSGSPHALTPLVGRNDEIATIVELLGQAGLRLITLTGPGGVGKTRLAMEVIAALTCSFADGIFVVELAPVREPRLVSSTIADMVGVREATGLSIRAALLRYFMSKQCLLVLDNFEHVLPAAPTVADLLAACPGLTVLVTSREPLHLRGERQLPVLPLRVPDAVENPRLEELAQSEATQLFVERVRDVIADFEVRGDNAVVVADICRRLDGLPLALELAAVWAKVLPLPELRRRLELRLPLLTRGTLDMPGRHRTLQATIAWSHDLLSLQERILFRRLAVFAGGWTLEGAESVAAEGLNPLEGIAALVDKSLVQPPVGTIDEPRYRMLETVREFALEQLALSGEAEEIGRRHATYCLDLAQAGATNLANAERRGGLALLEAEHANLRAALSWLRVHGLGVEGLKLAAAMGSFWRLRSAHAEGRMWLETFLDAPGASALRTDERVAALRWMGELAGLAGDPATAEVRLAESLSLARAMGDKRGVSAALGALASALVHRGDISASVSLFTEGIALAREQRDVRQTAFLLGYLAVVTGHQGDLAGARVLLDESDALMHTLGDTRSFEGVMLVFFQGWLALFEGAANRAANLLERSLGLARDLDAKSILSAGLAGLGEVALGKEGINQATALYREGLALGQAGNYPPGMVLNIQGFVRAAARRGNVVHVARLTGAIESLGRGAIEMLPRSAVVEFTLAVEDARTLLGEKAFQVEKAAGHTAVIAGDLEALMSDSYELRVITVQTGEGGVPSATSGSGPAP